MIKTWMSVATLLMASWSFSAQAQAQTTVAGVKFDNEITLGGQKLQLNGAGVRYRAVFKVYAAALYTSSKVKTNEDAIKNSTPGRIHLVALRDVGGDEFGKLFTKAMEANTTPQEFGKLINPVIRLGQIFGEAKQFKQGDTITIDTFPGTGMVMSIRGKMLGEPFKEPGFQALMYKIWFGSKPVDEALRGALLGNATTANTNVN